MHTRAHAMTEQEKRAAILDENSVTQRTSPVRALGPAAAAGPGAVLLPRSALGTLGLVGGVGAAVASNMAEVADGSSYLE